MKLVQITLDGVSRFSAITEESKFGVYITKKATDFIRAQSIDNNVYEGSEPVFPQIGICGMDNEKDDRLFISSGRVVTKYVKSEVWESPLVKKEGEWEWKEVTFKIVEVMED